MDDMSGLPDEFLPEIDDLPGDLAQLARDILRVVNDTKLAVRIVLQLEHCYRGTSIYLHNCDVIRRKVRNIKIVERYAKGDSVDDIARSVYLSARQVWTILGAEPSVEDNRQMKLF